ncbi:MAG: SRPBCC family protein [Rhizobiaceae bacterium]
MSNTEAPLLDSNDANYAHCCCEIIIDLKAQDFFDWYMHEPIENFMHGTLIVPPITGTEPLPGPKWGKQGAARKITFKDGTVASEKILSLNLPLEYHYQPWAYNNPVRLLSDYAKSTMRAEPMGDKTRIVWDYSFHARNMVALQPLKLFMMLDWKRNLENGLKVLKAHLEEHGTCKRIHETIAMKKAA